MTTESPKTVVYTCLPSLNWELCGYKFLAGYLILLADDAKLFAERLAKQPPRVTHRIKLLSDAAYAAAQKNERFARMRAKTLGMEAVAAETKAQEATQFASTEAERAIKEEDEIIEKIEADSNKEQNFSEPVGDGPLDNPAPIHVEAGNVGGLEESEAAAIVDVSVTSIPEVDADSGIKRTAAFAPSNPLKIN